MFSKFLSDVQEVKNLLIDLASRNNHRLFLVAYLLGCVYLLGNESYDEDDFESDNVDLDFVSIFFDYAKCNIDWKNYERVVELFKEFVELYIRLKFKIILGDIRLKNSYGHKPQKSTQFKLM